ncbi:immunoglobulin-binding protein 1 isoform X4 [Hyalella azteca]|uniref:Immunoglobulin-binding protein 1 isoform X1 n=1 Tax=Hyalella azteca TaxID=294128 RepID=A0A8B7NDZ2_HYAAZ|nr:immunoglobulin-binding protein 1 isoform X3 [Hyalella azteca]XP_018011828.1 immunoglobulin-binding protein 1 isoform X2 [Hyalella azteca]XP_047736264.1 immunoglobulin-binding protein 1 isoform X1 [Hyalella azteca]XP_047736265.1 immunoglobulin-binding protein 1 isoform X4 [Hyalella azteca]
MASNEVCEESVSELFDKTVNLFESIKDSNLDHGSAELQRDIEKCRCALEHLTLLVSQLGLFSDNEGIEELSTPTVKFLLLPALLGYITSRRKCQPFNPCSATKPQEFGEEVGEVLPTRCHILKLATEYYEDFITRCRDYGITNQSIPKRNVNHFGEQTSARPTPEQLKAMSQEREQKILRYKEKKRLELQLKELRQSKVEPDDETAREFYLKWLEMAIIESVEELESLGVEAAMLQRMAGMQSSPQAHTPTPRSGSFKPILITRDALQKKVFGLGYPSLPVMTVDELYEQRAKEGWYDKLSGPPDAPHDDADQRPDDEQNSDDDASEETRRRLAARDEYRDMHRRGWGNTYNRS